jgi:phosphoserine aminotransferase
MAPFEAMPDNYSAYTGSFALDEELQQQQQHLAQQPTMMTSAAADKIDPNHPALQGSLTPPANCPSSKVLNFSPGPTNLPSAVESTILRRCFPDPSTKRLGSMALSHRSPEFGAILRSTVDLARRVMDVPPEYEILFTQGGGHGQFAAVPMNLCPDKDARATYIVSGTWSTRAVAEAEKYCTPTVISSVNDDGSTFTTFPSAERIIAEHDPESKFIYMCSNETVNGIELHRLPVFDNVDNTTMPPLVVDASSDFTSKPITWHKSNVGILFACASKNIGHPGITMVIIRKDLLGQANPFTPGFLNYETNILADNVWNTIPTFNVDVIGIMMEWILDQGGIDKMEKNSIAKADLMYGLIEESNGFYGTPLDPSSEYRSRMNVPFCVAGGDETLTNLFLVECWNRGIVGLRTVTPFKQGIYLRASLYHGVAYEEVVVLANFMKEFAAMHTIIPSGVVVGGESKVVENNEGSSIEPASPLSSCVDLSHLSSSPNGVIDMSLTLPKNFKASRYAKVSHDMFAPPTLAVEPTILR